MALLPPLLLMLLPLRLPLSPLRFCRRSASAAAAAAIVAPVNPSWDETIVYRNIYPQELLARDLEVSVWSHKVSQKRVTSGFTRLRSIRARPFLQKKFLSLDFFVIIAHSHFSPVRALNAA